MWEFPEGALLSNIFPIHDYVHNPQLLWAFKVSYSPKMSRSPKAATIWSCAAAVWTSGQLSLLADRWQPGLVNRQRDPCISRTFTGPGGWRKEEGGPAAPSESTFHPAIKIECKC